MISILKNGHYARLVIWFLVIYRILYLEPRVYPMTMLQCHNAAFHCHYLHLDNHFRQNMQPPPNTLMPIKPTFFYFFSFFTPLIHITNRLPGFLIHRICIAHFQAMQVYRIQFIPCCTVIIGRTVYTAIIVRIIFTRTCARSQTHQSH